VPHTAAACDQARADAAKGYTPLLVSADGHYLGTISVADAVRPDSQEVIHQLQGAGVQHTVMLTGDQATTAQAIAAEVGVTDVRSELMPGDKVTAVRELQKRFGSVAMVGDGINDAPALAAADVGIAIGGSGATTQAMETADMTLMSDGLKMLPFAYRLSRAAMGNIRFNIAFAIGVKLIFVILVLVGQSSMWMAVAADMGTSLLVTLNGMRLLKVRP